MIKMLFTALISLKLCNQAMSNYSLELKKLHEENQRLTRVNSYLLRDFVSKQNFNNIVVKDKPTSGLNYYTDINPSLIRHTKGSTAVEPTEITTNELDGL